MSAGSARQAWIVAQVDLAGDECVVELGCGHGVAAALLCDRLPDGTYLGIDRSATMVAAAERRAGPHVEAGRARFQTATVVDASYPADVDVVLAIHLPVLDRGDPARELAVVRRHLATTGRLHVGFQPLDPLAVDEGVARLDRLAAATGFSVAAVVRGSPGGRPTAVVTLRPGSVTERPDGP